MSHIIEGVGWLRFKPTHILACVEFKVKSSAVTKGPVDEYIDVIFSSSNLLHLLEFLFYRRRNQGEHYAYDIRALETFLSYDHGL